MQGGLKLFDDVVDGAIVLQVVLDDKAEEFCFFVLFEDSLPNLELD